MESNDALRLAAGAASRGVMAKFGLAAGIIGLVLLLILGIFGGVKSDQAEAAESCGGRGTPQAADGKVDSTGQTATGDLHTKQVANAKIIDEVARKKGLPGRATLIALMTAYQESTVLNLDHGDRDSVGIFQQRPGSGWGTKKQLMTPAIAADRFFSGAPSGSPRGLTDINGWQSMPLGKVAQRVQNSAHPDLYDGQETPARNLAQDAGINLNRQGKGGGQANEGGKKDRADGDSKGCYPEPGESGGPGKGKSAPFKDGTDTDWPRIVNNPRSSKDAIAWARKQQDGGKQWYRRCLEFVAKAYGYRYAGVNLAIDNYRQWTPGSYRHNGDRHPPPGALMYWDTGKGKAGHVAIYLGHGEIASNDIKRVGYIDVVPANEIEKRWGADYQGWSPPYFPQGG
ncbi:CHAP domain-containing protein [Streptomyces lydicus]|uniref:CHAP domain-containing protein n=1 Tax=Streptomyces lydicus TaxID=47763 RepID=UPI0037BA9C2A